MFNLRVERLIRAAHKLIIADYKLEEPNYNWDKIVGLINQGKTDAELAQGMDNPNRFRNEFKQRFMVMTSPNYDPMLYKKIKDNEKAAKNLRWQQRWEGFTPEQKQEKLRQQQESGKLGGERALEQQRSMSPQDKAALTEIRREIGRRTWKDLGGFKNWARTQDPEKVKRMFRAMFYYSNQKIKNLPQRPTNRPLTIDEIWERMQMAGISSEASAETAEVPQPQPQPQPQALPVFSGLGA